MSDLNVYLDVDGVINAVNYEKPAWGWSDDYQDSRVDGLGVVVAAELVDALNRLAATPGVQMHWLTTWCDRAAVKLCPAIGLRGEDWPIVGQREHLSLDCRNDWWKLDAIQNQLPDGTRAIWLDDDIADDDEAQEWLEATPSVLWLSPDCQVGLTRAQMDRVVAWAGEGS